MPKNSTKTDDFVWPNKRKKLQKNLLAFPNNLTGEVCSKIRIIEPVEIASNLKKIKAEIKLAENFHTTKEKLNFQFDNKSVLVHRCFANEGNFLLKNIKTYTNCKIVYDIDDLITHIPEHNPFRAKASPPPPTIEKNTLKTNSDLLVERLKYTLTYCDVFTVSTPNLANFYDDLHKNIIVVPNRLDAEKWLPLYKNSLNKTYSSENNQKMRIGYAGFLSHQEDLKLISELIKQTHQQVDWIFFGDCRDEIRPFIKEYHDFVAMENYPQKLASLNLDLAVIPLQDDLFNSCKSNLKLLQLGILGIPLIVSDVGAYENSVGNSADFPITRIKKSNTLKAWKNAVLDHIQNPQETQKIGKQLQQKVLEFGFIQDHIDDYVKAWF